MLLQGLTLTIVGMSVVFIFLTLLVFTMKLLAIIVPKFFPEQGSLPGKTIKQTTSFTVAQPVTPVSGDNAEIAAAVAAISAYIKN